MSPCWTTVRLKAGCCAATLPVITSAAKVRPTALIRNSYSKTGDRNLLRAQWTIGRLEILRRLVVGEGDVREPEIDDRFAAIVDFGGGDDSRARLLHQGRAARERLAGVPDIVCEQDALAVQLAAVERAQREAGGGVVVERREAARGMCQAAAAVEEPGNRVRQQRTAGNRTGDDFRRLDELGRQDVQKILGKAPDGRRMSKQLMWIEVDAPVIAVAVVEMPVDHQDLQLLQILQRFLAKLSALVHRLLKSPVSRIPSRSNPRLCSRTRGGRRRSAPRRRLSPARPREAW